MIELLLSTILFFLSVGVIYWTHSQHRIPVIVDPEAGKTLPPQNLPLISVIVPTRNEERNIRRCVRAVLSQTYQNYELLVVDDHSTDATPNILAELAAAHPERLRIIRAPERPAGWAGKPHAVWIGAQAARGDWLCFIDADTFACPALLTATLATARQNQADLFTILTDQELGSFWERTVLPLVFTALSVGFPADRVNDPQAKEAIANGQFILIRRQVYEAVGGHQAVHSEIAEDKALAERVKGAGFRLIVADGRQVAVTRMYTRFSEIWEGWTKNIFLGMRDRLGLLFVGALVSLAGALVLPLWLLLGFSWWLNGGGWQAVWIILQGFLVWIYLLVQRIQAAHAFNISPFYALTTPLGALVFTAMMFTSAYNVISGRGVTWKGRRYL